MKTHADDVARRAVELMLEGSPSYSATFDARARRLYEEATARHVQALVGSVAAGDPMIFGDYTAWAADLPSGVDIPADQLAALFAATARAIAELAPAAAAAVRPHLEAGERALDR